MNRTQCIAQHLYDTGQVMVAVSLIVQKSASEWAIVFDNQDELTVTFDGDLGMLNFVSPIGKLPAEADADLLKLLLLANGGFEQSGGVQLALGENNQILQILRVPEHIEEHHWLQIIEDQREKVAFWRNTLCEFSGAMAQSQTATVHADEFLKV